MQSSGVLRRVTLVRTDVSEWEHDSLHPDNKDDTFLWNVGSYKSHTV
jgi:hypothetical protein